MFTRTRPKWLGGFTFQTASQVVAALLVLVVVAAFKDSRDAIASAVRWLAHPVGTPRVVFVLVLALAVLWGGLIVAALARRLFRTSPDTAKRRAEQFRSDFEALADNLRRWIPTDIAGDDANNQERYRDLRREVSTSSARVRNEFVSFIEQNPDWDLRLEHDEVALELNPMDIAPELPDALFTRLWKARSLPGALAWAREMDGDNFAEWIAARSDALDAFVRSMEDRG
jgi:hypothetical protein